MQGATKDYRTLFTFPILGVTSLQAETIITAVEIYLLGLAPIEIQREKNGRFIF